MDTKQLYDKGNVSSVTFSTSFGKELKLIEVPDDLFKLVEDGELLSIIGGDNTEAVLCSNNGTFSMKRVESSNSVYFVPPSASNIFSIESMCSDYYELKPIKGKVEQLKTILEPSQYRGFREERENPVDPGLLLTRAQVAATVQASKVEIETALRFLGVVDMKGVLRMLSISAVNESIQLLLRTLVAESWSLECISERACLQALPQIDPVILQHVLQLVGSPLDGEDDVWALSQDKVLIATARVIFCEQLSSGQKLVPVTIFLKEWAQQTPGVFRADQLRVDLLRGLALSETDPLGQNCLRFFPLSDLSQDPKTRFGQLFAVRSRFRLEELEPYLQDLFGSTPGLPRSQAEILVTYTKLIDGFYHLK